MGRLSFLALSLAGELTDEERVGFGAWRLRGGESEEPLGDFSQQE